MAKNIGYRSIILRVSILILLSACRTAEKIDPTQMVLENSGAGLRKETSPTNPSNSRLESLSGQTQSERSLAPTLSSASETPRLTQNTGQSSPEDSHTPTLPAPSDTPIVVQTGEAPATILPDSAAQPTFTPTLIPTQKRSKIPSIPIAPLPSSTANPAPTPTKLPTITSPPQPGMISGQILLHGAPLTQTVTLILEDQAYQVIQDMTVSNGEFRFEKLQASSEGYNVLFAQEENPQFGVEEVASWAWIGPIPVQDGDAIRLADMEIGLPGLQQIYPPLDTFLNSGPITPQNPLVFEWTPYPKASHYWLDLRSGSTLQLVWQTDFLDTNNTSFNGILANGETIQPGNYWWNVSARVEDSVMTVSGPLRSFFLNP